MGQSCILTWLESSDLIFVSCGNEALDVNNVTDTPNRVGSVQSADCAQEHLPA